jgi:hypothetical protein
MTLILLNYNNYYNRIVKRHSTLDEYIQDGANQVAVMHNVAFNPNDGVTTSQIVNIPFDIVPDYALVVDEDNEIISRWYILEAARTRAGQYQIDLLRDLIADSYEEIIIAPMFVEKAMVTRNDPRIFNNEAMTFNQIKTSETLLKDTTGVPWIVGYIARDANLTSPVTIPADPLIVDYDLTSLEGYDYYNFTFENPYKMSYVDFTAKMYIRGPGVSNDQLQVGWDTWGWPKMPELEVNTNQPPFEPAGGYCTRKPRAGYRIARAFVKYENVLDQVLDHTYGKDWIAESYAMTGIPITPFDLSGEEGKIIKAGDNYYRIKYNTRILPRTVVDVQSTLAYGQKFQAVAQKCDKLRADNITDPVGAIEYTAIACYFTYEPITRESISITISSARVHLTDAPYDIFAIPYGDIPFANSSENPTTQADVAMRLAQQLAIDFGKDRIYDLQILPYCPLSTTPSGAISMLNKEEERDYAWAKDPNNQKVSILFWLTRASFSTNIPVSLSVPENAIDFKIANECDKYRIVSPTYNGEFEFSATKNNGVSNFTAYCTYKPYNPFIKIVPLFNNLYGQEYLDGRGCICQGDFSLPQISSAWIDYQVNNKNYLNAFNRQIENMEVNNAVQRELEKWQVASGAITGVASGAVSGGIAGGTWGAVAGGVVGGAASLIGGIKDIQLTEKLRSEALDYTKDQFGYQLGNIKALPYSLANIGSQTIISKYIPMLEYYTCTTVEKDALRDKIKYNGMTVGTIGKIQDFQQSTQKTYIKGKLIRLENLNEEYHYVNAIANELNKGVFI